MRQNKRFTEALIACWRYMTTGETVGRRALFEAVNELWIWRMTDA